MTDRNVLSGRQTMLMRYMSVSLKDWRSTLAMSYNSGILIFRFIFFTQYFIRDAEIYWKQKLYFSMRRLSQNLIPRKQKQVECIKNNIYLAPSQCHVGLRRSLRKVLLKYANHDMAIPIKKRLIVLEKTQIPKLAVENS